MSEPSPVIEINDLAYAYGRAEAVHNLNLKVRAGRCYGLFGRNGAGKTTTMKCLLNLLRPRGGAVRVFGLDPARSEVEVKSRLAYVPDQVAFYPWMSVRETLDYIASFRSHWNVGTERDQGQSLTPDNPLSCRELSLFAGQMLLSFSASLAWARSFADPGLKIRRS
jgi:ABC-type multidrug transport system ATPase subunit